MKVQQFGNQSRPPTVPANKRRNRSPFQNRDHVPDPIRILWVILEHVEKTRIDTRIKYSPTRIVIQHPIVPEHVNAVILRRSRLWRRRQRFRHRSKHQSTTTEEIKSWTQNKIEIIFNFTFLSFNFFLKKHQHVKMWGQWCMTICHLDYSRRRGDVFK